MKKIELHRRLEQKMWAAGPSAAPMGDRDLRTQASSWFQDRDNSARSTGDVQYAGRRVITVSDENVHGDAHDWHHEGRYDRAQKNLRVFHQLCRDNFTRSHRKRCFLTSTIACSACLSFIGQTTRSSYPAFLKP